MWVYYLNTYILQLLYHASTILHVKADKILSRNFGSSIVGQVGPIVYVDLSII